MNYTKYVNVFQGTGKYVVPKENDGLYSGWNLLKGKAGNTSPAACTPFGGVACSPYSGGYPVGYGNHKINCGKEVKCFFEGDKIFGFSHFTHSGVGGIGIYYNYLVTTPYLKRFSQSQRLKEFDEERAEPGYYTCRLTEEDIRCEVTVGEKVAIHRYTSNTGEPLKIAVDFSNNGLRQQKEVLYSKASDAKMKVNADGSVSGFIVMEGVKLYFYIACQNGKSKGKLWQNRRVLQEKSLRLEYPQDKFGCIIETNSVCVETKIGFSFESEKNAKNATLESESFDIEVAKTKAAWEKRLCAIELYGVSDEDKEIFYSNYYHTLVKPCGWGGESFLWKEEDIFFFDFATLWDIYKTQLPFLFTLYKDVGRGVIKTLLRYGKERNGLFNALLISTDMNVESQQACCLGCYVLYDGYTRGLIETTELDDMFAVVKSEISVYAEDVEKGTIEKTTKLLDVCMIAESFAKLSKKLKRTEDAAYFAKIAKKWTKAYGKSGLLKTRYPYYEGNRWNYSFRFVHDLEKRIEIGGGKENILKQLDAFFGFEEGNPTRNRFEGFNNETDMETPYFYHYVGGYDRIAKIVDECVNVCFRTGRDGLPGNNDSGGLSACYLWNFLGLFPISGQNDFFLGVPKAEKAVLHLTTGKDLTVRSIGQGKEVEKVVFNGNEIDGYTISIAEIMQGGELAFYKRK